MNGWRPRAVPRLAVLALAVLALAACGSVPKKPTAGAPGKPVAGAKAGKAVAGVPADCSGVSPYAPAQEDPSTRGDYVAGGLYKPGVRDTTPEYVPNVACIPEPIVTDEPRSPVGNRSPYTVLGKQYYVMDRPKGYVEQGTASYYGAKFHGRRTSNQEVYDMYAFTAAHKTLPLPSFARVTNLDNGQSVVVRVNDRGPFHEGRVVDLSYAAAVKLGIIARGTGRVEVRALAPGDPDLPRQAGAAPKREPARPAPVAATTAAATPATGLDHLVQALPSSTGPAAPAPGVAMVPTAATGTVADATAPAGPLPVPQSGSYAPAGNPPPAAAAPVLQVASFSSLDNARRALDRLLAAGIPGARLDDVVTGGRTFWRLRVAPGGADATELAGRIAGLGFGTPQLVRE
ncbi:septal ring lytic transglycosylase RlpA family protein [Pseudoxanthomonas suwonensis]|uniref:Endolytic peptidoglycan transglycosylase RlpA n=1 Tax=Pseudoxanthomonas suwonensis TaxID=314722 RepID=A0A0E3UMY0_9GAMM|nr:septal ring lytic transglycosylase RlpA family protein [Pseudoxanthomonas suwonensis]AKC86465.1 Rare lipoprotein A Flags: Precursor [Pseudoxanthomonas suwonensis]